MWRKGVGNSDINDDGLIYGDCVTASGGRYAYLLTPVNEGGSHGGK